MIAALITGLLALLAWRHTIKPAIAFVVVSAAIGAYFMGAYGVVLDTTMMTNVLQTDAREVADLLSLQLLLALVLLAALPLVWLWRRPVQRMPLVAQSWRNLLTLVGALVLIAALVGALFADLSSTMRNHRSVRYLVNPINSFWALGVIAKKSTARPAGPLLPIGLDARPAGAGRVRTAAPAGPRRRRDGARRPLRAERLCAADQSGAVPRRRRQLHRCHIVRDQHRGVAALHVLGARSHRLQRPRSRPREPARPGSARRPGRAVDRQPVRLQGTLRPRAERDGQPGTGRSGATRPRALRRRRVPRRGSAHRPRPAVGRAAGRTACARDACRAAPDGQPRPGLLQALAGCAQALHARMRERGAARVRAERADQRLRQLDRLHRPRAGEDDRLAEDASREHAAR